jgi:hypothetical protein
MFCGETHEVGDLEGKGKTLTQNGSKGPSRVKGLHLLGKTIVRMEKFSLTKYYF